MAHTARPSTQPYFRAEIDAGRSRVSRTRAERTGDGAAQLFPYNPELFILQLLQLLPR